MHKLKLRNILLRRVLCKLIMIRYILICFFAIYASTPFSDYILVTILITKKIMYVKESSYKYRGRLKKQTELSRRMEHVCCPSLTLITVYNENTLLTRKMKHKLQQNCGDSLYDCLIKILRRIIEKLKKHIKEHLVKVSQAKRK